MKKNKKNSQTTIEEGLQLGNRYYIQWNRQDIHKKQIKILKVSFYIPDSFY